MKIRTAAAVAAIGALSVIQVQAQNQVLYLDGINDYLQIQRPVADSFTLEVWVNLQTEGVIGSNPQHCTAIYDNHYLSGSDDFGLMIDTLTPGLRIRHPFAVTSSVELVIGTWTHIAAVRDTVAGEARMYINGQLAGTKALPDTGTLDKEPALWIGRNHAGRHPAYEEYWCHAYIDECRFWNRTLTQGEIQANMYSVLSGSEAGLVTYMNFDENNFSDKTTFANNATVYGSPALVATNYFGETHFVITSVQGNGELTWTGPQVGATGTVQWASAAGGPWFSDWSSLSGIVVTAATTTVKIPMFFRVVSPSTVTPVARVAVTSPVELESTPIANMDSFPDQLGGSTIHCILPSYDIIAQGKVQFTVTQPGYLYLAVNFGYQGNDSGGWTSERWLKSDFEAAGWTFVPGTINGPGSENRDFEICRKLVTAGQTYSLRCNKYEPPYPIEPPTHFSLY